MKKFVMLGALVSATLACTPSGGKAVDATAAGVVNAVAGTEVPMDTLFSSIEWQGFKPGGGHNGTVLLKSGMVLMQDSTPVGGSFVVDMASIRALDLSEAMGKSKLEGHLASADFFDVAKHPTASFEIVELSAITDSLYTHQVTGNLALRDSVKQITFKAKYWRVGALQCAESEPFQIDRTQWGVTYSSKSIFKELKDKFINDEITLKIKLQSQVND